MRPPPVSQLEKQLLALVAAYYIGCLPLISAPEIWFLAPVVIPGKLIAHQWPDGDFQTWIGGSAFFVWLIGACYGSTAFRFGLAAFCTSTVLLGFGLSILFIKANLELS